VDLSALPAGIVDGVRVTPSAAPIEYGPNSVLGVVDIQTPISVVPGLRSLQGELATEHSGSLSAAGGVSAGDVDWLFGGGYRRIGGEAVSSRAVIPYGPVEDGARANTDLESTSLFVAASRQFDQAAARMSLLSVDAERGIANAGHIDPAVGLPRYWRYPHWRFDQLTLNVGMDIGASTSLRSVLWFQHFEQTIDQFADDSYSVVENSEDDEDNTLGGRMVLERPFDAFDLRLVGNAQMTVHEQVNTDHVNGLHVPLKSYQQNVFSLGAELDSRAGDTVDVSAALSYDLATTPKTGDYDAYDELSDWAASIAMRWYPSDTWQLAGTLGQRTRFPTLRELYGEAFGQFLLNPGLRPETTLLGDVTLEGVLRNGQVRLRLTPWMLRIDDTLSRRSLVVDGVRLRQRYNLEGSTGHGIEAGLEWNVHDFLELRLHASWQDLEARLEDDGTRPGLYQRPDVQASLVLDWVFTPAWDLFFEVRYMGEALDEDDYGTVVELPSSTSVDFRLFRTVQRDDAGQWRVYFGVDNLANDVVLPQLGLPQPGRTASLGVSFERL
jgi:outer membrane receptor protein involved in Fe transport